MSEPPKLAELLLRLLVGGRDADVVAGDLRETFEARGGGQFWYWGQAASCLVVRCSTSRRAIPGIGTDFSRALRRMRHNPGYAITAMVCLALALGVNTTLFSFLDSLYFRRLPVPAADRIVQIQRDGAAFCTWPEYFGFRHGLRSVEAAATSLFFDSMEVDRTGFEADVETVSSNYAQALRLGTVLGRWFGSEAETETEPPAVISYRLWKTHFAGDPGVLGKSVRVLGGTYWIAGVASPEFTGSAPPLAVDTWIPVRPSQRGGTAHLIGRMPPDATIASVTAEMRVVTARLRAANPGEEVLATPTAVNPYAGLAADKRHSPFTPMVRLLSAVSGMVLLIACVNVANLLLSRATVRQREIAIRRSLGASRARLFRETLAEGLVLAAGGLLLGVFFGYWSGRALELMVPSVPSPVWHGLRWGIDWRVGLFLTAAGAVCALLFSMPPALANFGHNLSPAMKGDAARHSRQREIYSVAQVALSLTLLIAAGLLLRAADRAQHLDLGFAYDHRLFVNLWAHGKDPKVDALVFSDLKQQARGMPGVEDATLAWEVFPGSGVGCAGIAREREKKETRANIVDRNYFDFMNIPIVKGRGFHAASPGAPQAIVNQSLAHALWPNEDPLGKTLWTGGCSLRGDGSTGATVVGVARDAKYDAVNEKETLLYYTLREEDSGNGYFALVIRTAGDPRQWSKPLLDLMQRNGRDLRIYEAATMESSVARSLWLVRWQASLMAALGLLAIVLAAIGVYGVVTCSVAQRTREIGVRMALGAVAMDVQWMVLGHGLRITAIGIAGGLLFSAGTVRLLRGFLYGLSPFDPIAFSVASLAWIAIAMVASWFPARRATRVDPMTALNYE